MLKMDDSVCVTTGREPAWVQSASGVTNQVLSAPLGPAPSHTMAFQDDTITYIRNYITIQ